MISNENKKNPDSFQKSRNSNALFVSGKDGYNTYRIPAIEVTNLGTILVFCEGRKDSPSDRGEIDILLKRSVDDGKTWSDSKVVWHDAGNTCGNPCVVADRITGTIWFMITWNNGNDCEKAIMEQTSLDTRRVFVLCSVDDGLTWDKPKDITDTVKKANWTWYATGPGSGIQIQHGKFKGRLVVPCDHIEAKTMQLYSHIVFSDDHGQTWQLGGKSPQAQVNECEVVELTNDRIMLNMRSHQYRQTSISHDGGITWQDQHQDLNLPDSYCQASILRYQWPDANNKNIIVFCNPANSQERKNLTLRFSFDEGKNWDISRIIHSGPCAYSDLAALKNGDIACCYEAGSIHYFESILFARIPVPL
ncbi:MAG: sialidase family protein [Lentisphaeria bacterium]